MSRMNLGQCYEMMKCGKHVVLREYQAISILVCKMDVEYRKSHF